MISFILGGARSGKSRHAESLAKMYEAQGFQVFYLATAQAFDDEMDRRIYHHQNNRPNHWQTIEEPIRLADRLQDLACDSRVILVDCLTLWLNNLLMAEDESLLISQTDRFLSLLGDLPYSCHVILVSNETGLGVVPMGQITRRFVDESGFLHQKIAQLADEVIFCVAGLPMTLKPSDKITET